VHNEDIVRQLEKKGIKKITGLSAGKNKTLLLAAHGTSLKIINRANELGYKIIDATCPMVKEIHRIAKDMENKGYRIIVIGDKKHAEVLGISGQLKNKTIVMDSLKNLPPKKLQSIEKAAVVVQSTQNLEKVLKIVGVLKQRIRKLEFFNTICQPTRIKQKDLKVLPKANDAVIIIGSKKSANTKRLYEISKSLNKRSYWVAGKKEIKSNWFKNAKSVGITAGASTPDSTTQEIIEYIRTNY